MRRGYAGETVRGGLDAAATPHAKDLSGRRGAERSGRGGTGATVTTPCLSPCGLPSRLRTAPRARRVCLRPRTTVPTHAEREAPVAERNPQVMEMVAKELEKDPEAKADSLFEKARKIDPSIGDLSLRQFHARYPLPLKRKRSAGKGRARRPRSRAKSAPPAKQKSAPARRQGAPRDEVRRIFLEFASDLARAESRASIVDVLAKVDDYVDRVIVQAGR